MEKTFRISDSHLDEIDLVINEKCSCSLDVLPRHLGCQLARKVESRSGEFERPNRLEMAPAERTKVTGQHSNYT